jgi:hypothetical protein
VRKQDRSAAWVAFVAAAPIGTRVYDLAAVVGQPTEVVDSIRHSTSRPHASAQRCEFAELFARWHGRPPADADWPVPRVMNGRYEWQAPEIALMATLVGQMSVDDIAVALTARLRTITSDARAMRTKASVACALARSGLQTGDVLGGITVPQAGRQLGTEEPVRDAIRRRELRANKVGRLLVIPHADWQRWRDGRRPPPEDFVSLASLKQSLAIKSDKLAEFAKLGYVPDAALFHAQPGQASSVRGTWYVPKVVAEQMLADRRAGRPMPWQGKPLMTNLRQTWHKWQPRKHPTTCETCARIWGEAGAPATWDDFIKRYPPLELGAKRHLTRQWSPGLTATAVARKAKRSLSNVLRAIQNGQLKARIEDGKQFVSQTDATLWIARGAQSGERAHEWIALSTASDRYGFSAAELAAMIADERLTTRVEPLGPGRGTTQVPWRQVAQLREEIGFTEEQAAAKVGVSVPELRGLLDGVQWRLQSGCIPLVTVQALVKRRQSNHGHTVEDAAAQLGRSVTWIEQRLADGVARLHKNRWSTRPYLTDLGLEALREAAESGSARWTPPSNWMISSQAAGLAAVSKTTLGNWAEQGLVTAAGTSRGPVYEPESVKAQARAYWANARFVRDLRPDWLKAEVPIYQPRGRRGAAKTQGSRNSL